MTQAKRIALAALLAAGLIPAGLVARATDAAGEAAVPAPEKGRITGIGGIFYKSKDPVALAAWYRDVLGLHLEEWGGALLRTDAPGRPPVVVWSLFPETSDYMAPSTREFMINFAVDDLDAFIDRIEAKGVTAHRVEDTDPNGRFAWIVDPDGTKIELWEPKPRPE